MLRFPMTFGHNSFGFNDHFDSNGGELKSQMQDTVVVDERVIDTAFRDLRDPLHLGQGGMLGRVHKGMTLVTLRGRILVPNTTQQRRMGDRERALLAAFDPYLCYRDSPTTEGAYPFNFTEETTDTSTYTAGLIRARYYARPLSKPRIGELAKDKTGRTYNLALVAGDPRMYEQTEQSQVFTPASATHNLVNRGNAPAPLKVTIVMGGAGNVAFTITRGTVAFVLNLTGLSSGNTVVVLMETSGPYGIGKTVTLNGAAAFSRKTSNAASWLDVPVGTTQFVISNHSNVTSCTLAWHSARA